MLSAINFLTFRCNNGGKLAILSSRAVLRSLTRKISSTPLLPATGFRGRGYLRHGENSRILGRKCALGTYERTPRYWHNREKSEEGRVKMWTEVTTDHLTPEIKLYLITPRCPLWHSRGEESPFVDPFWAFYWPGGQALSRYILDNPEEFEGRRVLDVGSGCGAAAIAAKMAGADVVIANDIDPISATAIRLNSSTNGIDLLIDTGDLIGQFDPTWEVVVIGDMFYDPEFAKLLLCWVKVLLDRNVTIYIGDPGRASFKSLFSDIPMEKVFTAELSETLARENNGFNHTSVWKCL